MRQCGGVSRRVYAKPDTCTERRAVDPTGISVKVSAQYPGRSDALPRASGVGRRCDGVSEVSRGHSSCRKFRQRRAEPVMSGQSHVLSAWTERKLRGDTGAYSETGEAGSLEGDYGCLLANRRHVNGTKLAGAVRPVDRNRRMRNRMYGGVGGRRG